ncbi:uncharacterized protein LOC141693045 [Apium graveolens]|uniref:uncharacterized protein LOC141693045 n=1 Tax=Apium graveolens TaxID=4045 RepID=UPI003D7A231E
MSIHHLSLPPQNLSISSSTYLSGHTLLTLLPKFSHLSLTSTTKPSTLIRMGGGPRTFPGGVNKWQWKRMQAKKAKQLLKARLARERQIYEMRKRAELKAAVSELERPWEVVEKAPKLFSARADEQVQVLADRFQKPGGFDLWSEEDGPELFKTVDGFPSARFFPKGVVHSIRPYGRVNDQIDDFGGLESEKGVKVGSFDEIGGLRGEKGGKVGSFDEFGGLRGEMGVKIGSFDEFGGLGSGNGVKIGSFDEYVGKRNVSNEGRGGEGSKGRVRKKRHGRSMRGLNSSEMNDGESNGRAQVGMKDGSFSRGMSLREVEGGNSRVRDMNWGDRNNGLDSRRVRLDRGNSGRLQVVKKDGSFSQGMRLREVEGGNSGVSDIGLRDTNNGLDSKRVGLDRENSRRSRVVKKGGSFSKGMRSREVKGANSEVYDMDLQRDGSYWFKEENE